jgi:hypothetical protein
MRANASREDGDFGEMNKNSGIKIIPGAFCRCKLVTHLKLMEKWTITWSAVVWCRLCSCKHQRPPQIY